ncbi:MAG TPA: hypothetical protein VK570_15000 [Rubrivivax sp.]|nr:hypothetical protein [Rubrivivax sp.]
MPRRARPITPEDQIIDVDDVIEIIDPVRDDIERIANACRKRVRKRAMLAAGVAMIPVPGLDWMTDIGVLVKLLPEINAAFGLSPEQIERLGPERQMAVYKAISAVGGMVAGRVVTQKMVLGMLKLVGVRLSTQQAAKYMPLAGQAVSAALTFSALQYICEQHIRQCVAVTRHLQLAGPSATADTAP